MYMKLHMIGKIIIISFFYTLYNYNQVHSGPVQFVMQGCNATSCKESQVCSPPITTRTPVVSCLLLQALPPSTPIDLLFFLLLPLSSSSFLFLLLLTSSPPIAPITLSWYVQTQCAGTEQTNTDMAMDRDRVTEFKFLGSSFVILHEPPIPDGM